MPGFFATGGSDLGGHGQFATSIDDHCLLKITDLGLRKLLDGLGTVSGGSYKLGLYSNNWIPRRNATILDIVPANFSGYSGLQLLQAWSPAASAGLRAESRNAVFQWTHNGGPITNTVYGWYVVDPFGQLIWAQRFCPDPVDVDIKGRFVKVQPLFHLRNDDQEK